MEPALASIYDHHLPFPFGLCDSTWPILRALVKSPAILQWEVMWGLWTALWGQTSARLASALGGINDEPQATTKSTPFSS